MELNKNEHKEQNEHDGVRSDDRSCAKHVISEDERTQVRDRTNTRIAHACSFLALVVILIDFAAFVIGQGDEFFTKAGIMISIALLAIAMLNNPTSASWKKSSDRASGHTEDAACKKAQKK